MEGSDGAVIHAPHVHHHHHEEPMDEVAVAIISSGTTIICAMAGAAIAMRLFRALVQPRNQNPEVVQVDIGAQPFRPFAGQAYHLADVSKAPSEPHKDTHSVTSPVSQALPSNSVTQSGPLPQEDGATM